MRLRTTPTITARRVWTVELRPQHGRPLLVCAQCEVDDTPLPSACARSAALAHLALHARGEALPAYLRTCQCHQRGCRWHPRHRGCAGSIRLVLSRAKGGRLWRLADVCAACAGATPDTAVVPDTVAEDSSAELPSSGPARSRTQRRRQAGGPFERGRVREMLSYLAASLPLDVSAEARLLALQCALRADRSGLVRIPAGLQRGMQLDRNFVLWQELESAGWIRVQSAEASWHRSVTVQILDDFSQSAPRAERARAADWALRAVPPKRLSLLSATGCLAVLVLTAHTPAAQEGGWDAEQLARLSGLPDLPHLHQVLGEIEDAGFLAFWKADGLGDLHWRLPTRPVAAHDIADPATDRCGLQAGHV
ncbi:hypothetical protein [Streptomyces sp. NPDC127033]|uniref:hypothetical protein n=1 Tax=Streptomyces sp. NPDC127033 TaxID=3347110 RepID=UPI003661B272